ncbi:MAG: hypothetical protein ACREJO_00375 [Phycisphaerales bacterium]
MLGLLDSLFSRERICENYDAPGTAELAVLLTSGDFAAVEKQLATNADHDWRCQAFLYLSRPSEGRAGIARWFKASRGEGQSLIAQGYSRLHGAWEARGSGMTPSNYAAFQQGLREGEQLLKQAAMRSTKDPAPYPMILAVCRGRELGVPATLEAMSEALATKGGYYSVACELVQSLASKWGAPQGVIEREFMKFLAAVPPGNPAHAMACSAAVEMVSARAMAQGAYEPEMFNSADVRSLVSHAETFWMRAQGRKPHVGDRHAHSLLGFCHWSMSNTTLAQPHLKAIYPHFSSDPWSYFGRPAAMAKRAAKECGIR